jgi:hypothetical protein
LRTGRCSRSQCPRTGKRNSGATNGSRISFIPPDRESARPVLRRRSSGRQIQVCWRRESHVVVESALPQPVERSEDRIVFVEGYASLRAEVVKIVSVEADATIGSQGAYREQSLQDDLEYTWPRSASDCPTALHRQPGGNTRAESILLVREAACVPTFSESCREIPWAPA